MKMKLCFDLTYLETEKNYLSDSIELNQGLLSWHRSRFCDFDSFYSSIEVQRLMNQIYKFQYFISCIEDIEKYFSDLLDFYPLNIKSYNMKGGVKMKFYKNKVVFVGLNRVKSKTGNELVFIKIADPVTYENLEMFPVNDLKYDNLVPGDVYDAELDCSGRYANLNLLSCK